MTLPPLQPVPVASPCIKVCVLDRDGVCTGCGRSLDEIAAWSRLEPQAQRQIVEAAAGRREHGRLCAEVQTGPVLTMLSVE